MREIIEYLESILDLPEEKCKIHLRTLISLLKYKDFDTEKVKQFKLEKVKRMVNYLGDKLQGLMRSLPAYYGLTLFSLAC